MLRFRGSPSSTWYGRMDIFLMDLGFTKSEVGSNLYFKVECKRLVYDEDLIQRTHCRCKEVVMKTERAPQDGVSIWDKV